MQKTKKIICLILIIVFSLFVTSCEKKDKNNNNKNNIIDDKENNKQNETIGNKSDELYLDYIYFEITNLDKSYQDTNGNKINVAEIKILKSYNDILNVETDYSKYINEHKDDGLLIEFSDTYFKYLQVGDTFIYKLEGIKKIQNKDETEIFTTIYNEFALYPIVENENSFAYFTSNILCSEEEDYEMKTIIIERIFYYGTDLDKHFIEYDYYIAYYSGEPMILNSDNAFNRFDNVLKSLKNETKDDFYKLKYSELYSQFYVFEYNDIIDNYLLEMGGI